MTTPASRNDLVDFINERLAPDGVVVTPETPLFETGLIDSMGILRLIAWVERAIGRPIPDRQIRMDNFRHVDRIVETFMSEGEGPAPATSGRVKEAS